MCSSGLISFAAQTSYLVFDQLIKGQGQGTQNVPSGRYSNSVRESILVVHYKPNQINCIGKKTTAQFSAQNHEKSQLLDRV